jgi:transcriptional regulator with XRE-family HTH domain
VSQLDLALLADVSGRHISFLETGRSQPSLAMIGRLSAALQLPPAAEADLRRAAGFAPHIADGLSPRLSRGAPSTAEWLLDGALKVQTAASEDAMVTAAEDLLAAFGVDNFFCVTLFGPSARLQSLRSQGGRFPTEWLENYGRRSYHLMDPLRQEAGRSHTSFFWSDLPDRMGSMRPEQRRILQEAGDYGITNGFVCPVRLADGRVRGVSMMGGAIDHKDPMVRLALQTIGGALLLGWDRFEAAAQHAA